MLRFSKLVIFTLLGLFLFSCDDDDDFIRYGNNIDAANGIIVNASPSSGDLFFFADANQVNSNALNFSDAQGYFRFFTGDRTFSIQDNTNNVLAQTDITLADNDIFSAFAVNDFDNIELVVYDDDLVVPDTGFSHIRFINLSPDASGITISEGTNNLTENLEFKSATNFIEVDAGTYDFQITDTATGNVLFDSGDVNLFSRRIYTIYTKGFVTPPTGSNDTFSTETLRNF